MSIHGMEEIKRSVGDFREWLKDYRALALMVIIEKEIKRLRAERDEARRLLHAMVEHIDETTLLNKTPKHDCDFDQRPERGSCKFCENWTAANISIYGEEYTKKCVMTIKESR